MSKFAQTYVDSQGRQQEEHKHVRRDIDVMLQQLEVNESKFGRMYLDTYGRKQLGEVAIKFEFYYVAENGKRDISVMLQQLEVDTSKFGCTYLDSTGRKQEEYRLPKDLTLTLVSGYKE